MSIRSPANLSSPTIKGVADEVGENQFVLVEDSLLMTGCPYRKLNPVGVT